MPDYDYTEYINSLDWKRKRQGFIARAGYVCQRCGAKYEDVTLQVHHLHYHTLGEEKGFDVEVLCINCHKIADAARRQKRRRQREAVYMAGKEWDFDDFDTPP